MASIFARIYPGFESFQTPDLSTYINALSGMLQPVSDLAGQGDNDEDGWSSIVDLTRVPDAAVPWLAQFIGIRFLNPILTVAQKKAQIAAHVGWDRGTPAAMQAAIAPYLSGQQRVKIQERDTSPYHFLITTFASETPSNHTAIINAINSQKPAGLQYTYQVSSGNDYAYVAATYATYNTVRTTFATYNGLLNLTPGG